MQSTRVYVRKPTRSRKQITQNLLSNSVLRSWCIHVVSCIKLRSTAVCLVRRAYEPRIILTRVRRWMRSSSPSGHWFVRDTAASTLSITTRALGQRSACITACTRCHATSPVPLSSQSPSPLIPRQSLLLPPCKRRYLRNALRVCLSCLFRVSPRYPNPHWRCSRKKVCTVSSLRDRTPWRKHPSLLISRPS